MKRFQSKDHTETELLKSAKFHCLVLMTKYWSKAMDMMD